ncbi:unnamed protein product [Malus baccata var. baccata]
MSAISTSSRVVIVSLLVSLLVLTLVGADETVNNNPEQISVLKKIVLDVVYHLGLISARGHAGLVASVAAVFLQVPPAILRPARVTPPSPPTAADASVLKTILYLETQTNVFV